MCDSRVAASHHTPVQRLVAQTVCSLVTETFFCIDRVALYPESPGRCLLVFISAEIVIVSTLLAVARPHGLR